MTVSTPPRPPDSIARNEQINPTALQEEALIEEARQRARRRRRRFGILAFASAAAVALTAFVVGRGGGADRSVTDAGRSGALEPRSDLARNGPLAIVSAKAGDGSGGGIYEVGKNGLGRRVFHCLERCYEIEGATWAPDGKRLAYGVESIGGNPEFNGLYVLDVARGKSRQIRQWNARSERGGWDEIAWSPDGQTIAYVTGANIFLIRPDGTYRTTLDTGTASAAWPSWSPDGTRIAFATSQNGPARDYDWPLNGSIYAMNVDGTHRTLIARNGTAPAWSPDGTRIAYLSGCGPPPFRITKPTGIRIVTPTGRNLTPPAETGCATVGIAGAPAWSPDGTKIAIANRTGVYLTDADGTNLTQVSTKAPTSIASNHLGWARPAWQPIR